LIAAFVAGLAQLVEQRYRKPWVKSSTLLASFVLYNYLMKYFKAGSGKIIVSDDYSKEIIFDQSDLPGSGHLLQIVTIPPQTKQRLHYHNKQTEIFYILEGECHIFINDKEFVAKVGDAFICSPGDTHNLWNKTDKPFKLAVFKIDLPEDNDTNWSK
jgi:mannose-6-phosphate isomerase-like protein (cupin superfamily)